MSSNEYQLIGVTNHLSEVADVEDIADYTELQMDRAERPLAQLSNYGGDVPLIVSNCSERFGSEVNTRNRLEMLVSAASIENVEMVDIELQMIQENNWILSELGDYNVDIVVSYYNFDQTPGKESLQKIILECDEYGDSTKVVVFAEKEKDTLCLLQCINESSDKGMDISGYSLGDIGKHTRIISTFYGSQMIYAPITANSAEYSNKEINLKEIENHLSTIRNAESIELANQLTGEL